MLKGAIDIVNKGRLIGWLTTENGEAVQQVDCLVDGQFASSAEAFFRQDLQDAGVGDGKGGVRASLPGNYFDGRVHRLTLVGCGSDEILGEVTKEVELPRLLPLNPNPFLEVTHGKLEGWTSTLQDADGFSAFELIGSHMPYGYSRYTRFSFVRSASGPAGAGLSQEFSLPPRSESRRTLVVFGKTPTLTALTVEVCNGADVLTREVVTLTTTWATYHVALGKTEDATMLRLSMEAEAGVAIVDLAVIGLMEWNGRTNALPPPPDRVEEELKQQATQRLVPAAWSRGSAFSSASSGAELADGWWFDSAQEESFSARLVTSGTDLGAVDTIGSALAVRHAPLSEPSRIVASLKRGAFLSLPAVDIAVTLSYSHSGTLVPPRTTIVLMGRAGNSRTVLWSQAVDSPLPGRTVTLVAKLSGKDMDGLRVRGAAFPSLEVGVEFKSAYAVTLHEIKTLPPSAPSAEIRSRFEDAAVEGQSKALLVQVESRPQASSLPVLADVVVPVFNATDFVKDNLLSLIGANDGSYRIVVVDDASGSRTRRLLADIAESGAITLISHPTNQGYTRSVNAGIREGDAPFVITLNSDTVVPRGWHRRLLEPFQRFERLGIAGPLSSAGSWQSVPFRFSQNGGWLANSLPFGHDVESVQHWLGSTWQPAYPEIPLLNGFCLCTRREVFDQVGLFDEAAFPVGYGEENDLCLRAAKEGWQLRVVDDLYIFHAKSKSFGKHRGHLSKAGTGSLKEKHPTVDWAELDATLRHHQGLRAVRTHFGELIGAVE